MAKLVKCKVCGQEIAKSAKTCPYCGAKHRSGAKGLGILILVLGIFMVIGALMGGGDDGPKKVEETASEQGATVQTSEPETQTVFGVGDTVELNDVFVTLVSVDERQGSDFMTPDEGKVFLICEFEIENNSDREIAVSTMLSFEAYVDDYAVGLDLGATVSAEKQQLDGSIAAGKKMNGVVGYAADTDWSELEIRFTPDFWSGKEIIFQYSK